MNDKIATIIPFFQEKEGLLLNAVVSALKQKYIDDLEIIVVDDGSPVSAFKELRHLLTEHPIKIIEQQNAGPAAARNKALDSLDDRTEYVAFLDSDDQWTDVHLKHAVSVLDRGFDFYFSDFFQPRQVISAFNRAKRLNIGDHKKFEDADNLYEYKGDMANQVLTGNVIGTPTVVYRYKKFPKLRFHEEFFYAGEDYLFWLELSKLTDRIAFSSLCECICGEGVNVYSGSGWGTDKSLDRLQHEIMYRKSVQKLFTLNDIQRKSNRQQLYNLRYMFVRDILHRLSHSKKINRYMLFNQLRIDPRLFVCFFHTLFMIGFSYLKRCLSSREPS